MIQSRCWRNALLCAGFAALFAAAPATAQQVTGTPGSPSATPRLSPGALFIKYAPGATHAPHLPTKEWVEKISRMKLFDEGYNKKLEGAMKEKAKRD